MSSTRNVPSFTSGYDHSTMASGSRDPQFLIDVGLGDVTKTIKRFALGYVTVALTKTLVSHVVFKFFESDVLPFDIHYVDLWPQTCQKVRKTAEKIWSRRVEGTALTGVLSSLLGLSWLYSDQHWLAQSIHELAMESAGFIVKGLGLTGYEDVLFPIAYLGFPSAIGSSASVFLGSYDIISKYFSRDRDLEIKPIFKDSLQSELDEILAATRLCKQQKGFYQNLLLYGFPGTGKTMISRWIARHSEMNYIFLSGGDLLKTQGTSHGPGACVEMLQKLIAHATNLRSPTVLFIDEAEACFPKRGVEPKSQELRSLLTAFLELTGQGASKMMLILATNRPKDLDEALLSRMNYKLHVGLPEIGERRRILEKTIELLINTPEEQQRFTAAIIDHLAKQTEGFSGRDIFTLINRLKIQAQSELNIVKLNDSIQRYVLQEAEIENLEDEHPLKNNRFYPALSTPVSSLK